MLVKFYLTHFSPSFISIPRENFWTKVFLLFSGIIEMEHWIKMIKYDY